MVPMQSSKVAALLSPTKNTNRFPNENEAGGEVAVKETAYVPF